jgi:hypothetical protein
LSRRLSKRVATCMNNTWGRGSEEKP